MKTKTKASGRVLEKSQGRPQLTPILSWKEIAKIVHECGGRMPGEKAFPPVIKNDANHLIFNGYVRQAKGGRTEMNEWGNGA